MTKTKAASLSGSLLARKGDATAAGIARSPHDRSRLSLTAIEPAPDPDICYPEPPTAKDHEDGIARAFGFGRELHLDDDDDWTAAPAWSGRGWLHLWLLVPLAGSLIAAAGYFSVAWYIDDPPPDTGVASVPARVEEALVAEAILPEADADTVAGTGTDTGTDTGPGTDTGTGTGTDTGPGTDTGLVGPLLSASNDPSVDGTAIAPAILQPPADEPVVALEQPPEAPTAEIDAAALAGKAPPPVTKLPPLRTAESGTAPSLTASAAGATAVRQGYLVQLYALGSDTAVRREWRRLRTRHSDLFEGLQLTVERVDLESPKRSLFRMLAGRIESAAAAKNLCLQARQRKLDCIVVRP